MLHAHARGVSVEGELGVLAEVEDHVFSASSTYTNPLDAVEFFQKTGVDALAISYGTMHGASKGKDVKSEKRDCNCNPGMHESSWNIRCPCFHGLFLIPFRNIL